MRQTLTISNHHGQRHIAFDYQTGRLPAVVFLPGFASTMSGTKAKHLAAFCGKRGQAFLTLDYSGHGASSGEFAQGGIGLWLDDSLAVLDAVLEEAAVFIGSSMGAWLMLLAAIRRPQLAAGLIGVASAPDFLNDFASSLTPEQKRQLAEKGQMQLPSDYGDPLTLTQAMIKDARRYRIMGQPMTLPCPCHLIHGQCDFDIPWTKTVELASQLDVPHVTVELIKDGGHRLSRPSDLKRMELALLRMIDDMGSE